jgi:uncharacterized hydrophobic protein (TIGR00271 family)
MDFWEILWQLSLSYDHRTTDVTYCRIGFSISGGDKLSMKHSLLISIGGIITAIGVGFFLTLPLIHFYQPENIEQVMVRTSPRLLDLLAALITGFAGAFAMSRHDVSDTLPGVAIAISLVPPLANVGILLASSNYSLAMGSMLLFMTNYFAIIITGAVLFGIMGFSKVSIMQQSLSAKRKGITLALVILILISVPLAYTGYNIFIDHSITNTVNDASNVWLNGSDYEVISTEITSDKSVLLRIIGDGELPALEKLEENVNGKIHGRKIKIEVVRSSTYHLDDN